MDSINITSESVSKSFVEYWEKRTKEIQEDTRSECYTAWNKVFEELVQVYLVKVAKSINALFKCNIDRAYQNIREEKFSDHAFCKTSVFFCRESIIRTLCSCFDHELFAEFEKNAADNIGDAYKPVWERATAFNDRLIKLNFDIRSKLDSITKDCMDGLMLAACSDTLRAKAWGIFLNNMSVAKDEYQKELATLSEEIHAWRCEIITETR